MTPPRWSPDRSGLGWAVDDRPPTDGVRQLWVGQEWPLLPITASTRPYRPAAAYRSTDLLAEVLTGRVATDLHLQVFRSFGYPVPGYHHRQPVTGLAHGRYMALYGHVPRNRCGAPCPHLQILAGRPGSMRGSLASWRPENKRSSLVPLGAENLTDERNAREPGRRCLPFSQSHCHSYSQILLAVGTDKLLTRVWAFPGPYRGMSARRHTHYVVMWPS